MSTFYLDIEGGNDAADGLSYANRWKTFATGASAARIAPGDTIRVMASPDPTSLGINATWNSNSPSITLASALNVLIDNCDTAWTASANVTTSADTSTYRTSTAGMSCTIAGAFTTGLVAYKALSGATDYSAYQGITLWLKPTSSVSAGVLSIRLCSDAAGVTTVDTLAIPALPTGGSWIPLYIDKGSALGSSIQSIALYADTDPGSAVIYLDNISTVKAQGADSLNLTSLLGKNTTGELWWAIRSINGTAVVLDDAPNMTPGTTPRGYVGTTETVATYKRETIKPASGLPEVHVVNDSGTSGNPITFSCGWNRTDMSTQTGYSYVDGINGSTNGVNFNNQTFVTLDRFYGVRYSTAIVTSANDSTLGTVGSIASYSTGINITGSPLRVRATNLSAVQSPNVGINFTSDAFVCTTCLCYGTASGVQITGRGVSIETLRSKNTTNNAISFLGTSTNNVQLGTVEASNSGAGLNFQGVFQDLRIKALTCASNTGTGLVAPGGVNNRIDVATLTSNGTAILLQNTTFLNAALVIGNLTTSGNTTVISTGTLLGNLYINRSSFAEATPVTYSGTGYTSGRIVFQNYDGVTGDHRTYYGNGTAGATVVSDTSTRHTSSGASWKFNTQTTTFVTSDFPIVFPVARIAVAANLLVTATLWTRRAATTVTGTFRCRGGQLLGISSDVTASSAAGANTWEQLTLTFTPTEEGVLDLDFLMYGASSVDLFIHEFAATQA